MVIEKRIVSKLILLILVDLLMGQQNVPDIILHNANIITMDDQLPNAQAVAISGNLIEAVGSNSEILALQTVNTEIIDLNGKTVLPGLIEGHDHFINNGYREGDKEGLAQATLKMAANGYTTVHQLAASPHFIETAQELAEENRLAVRINFYPNYNSSCNQDGNPWNVYAYTEKKDTTVRVVGIKVYADGGGGCGLVAAVTVPYINGGNGDLFRTQEEMNDLVETILDAGYPVAMHAIGDSAMGVGLNAFEKYFNGQGNTKRCRMEHLSIMREDLTDKMADLGIIASIQYTWGNSRRATDLESGYQPQVLEWMYPWRQMADKGIPIVGGNDFPRASRIHSMQTISYLATRKNERSDTLAAWLTGNQLTVEEGLIAMTKTNAWAVFEEDVKGSITPGKLADITVLSDNPLDMDPFDVRYIDVEMTIMDGIIRHNQIGKTRNVTHNAGTFSVGIDDRGLWGYIRSPIGLHYNGIEQMYQGSMLVSYDTTTIATATFQSQDYETTSDGWVVMEEPGTVADEEVVVEYEDVSTNHQNSVITKQESYMWNNDPFILVKYSFDNSHPYTISDLYFGPYMGFNITGSDNSWTSYADDLAGWEENNGLGFAYMYDKDNTSPYIGLAMFDESGNHVNNSLTFSAGHKISPGGDKERFSKLMRNNTFEQPSQNPRSYTILMANGPYEIDGGQSISPFFIAIIIGKNLEELKDGVNSSYQRLTQVLSIETNTQNINEFRLYNNYPNPFNPSTNINYSLPNESNVTITVYDILGQEINQIISQKQSPGNYSVQWNGYDSMGNHVGTGIYFYKIQAGDFIQTKKMALIR